MASRSVYLIALSLLSAVVIVSPVPIAAAGRLQSAFASASAEYGVPPPVLMALSYVETRWEDHGAMSSFWRGYGVMHLQDNPRNDGLMVASNLTGVAVSTVQSDLLQNVRAAAALLRQGYRDAYPDDAAMSRSGDVGRWYLPVAGYLRAPGPAAKRNYADAVFGTIAAGKIRILNGEAVNLAPTPGVQPDRGDLTSVPNDKTLAAGARSGAAYRPDGGQPLPHFAIPSLFHAQQGADSWLYSPNYNAGRPNPLVGVVIHTCEATSTSCQATLTTQGTGKSAHWQVYSGNGWREQYVHREDRSWHCGQCPAAAPWYNWNEAAVGIEHEGFSNAPATWYTPWMYSRSAWLTAWTCYLYNFGCDRNHVVGHDQVQTGNSDPGPGWDWGWYMYCVGLRVNYLVTGQDLLDCL